MVVSPGIFNLTIFFWTWNKLSNKEIPNKGPNKNIPNASKYHARRGLIDLFEMVLGCCTFLLIFRSICILYPIKCRLCNCPFGEEMPQILIDVPTQKLH